MFKKRKKPGRPKKVEKRKKASRRGKKGQSQIELDPKVIKSIAGLLLFLFAFIILLSFFAQGVLLEALNSTFTTLFSWEKLFLPWLLFLAGSILIFPSGKLGRPTLFLGSIIFFITIGSLFKAGKFGLEIWESTVLLLSAIGAFLIYFFGLLISFLVIFEFSLPEFFAKIPQIVFKKKDSPDVKEDVFSKAEEKDNVNQYRQKNWQDEPLIKTHDEKTKFAVEVSSAESQPAKPITLNLADKLNSNAEFSKPEEINFKWQLPLLSLLGSDVGNSADHGDVNKNAQTIEDTFDSFGVQAKVMEIHRGPTVTQYAIEPAIGTKLTKITTLSNDLALRLAAKTGLIRIEAPIPGKSLVGIEVPNIASSTVTLKKMLSNSVLRRDPSKLTVALGVDVNNNPIIMDIAKMPHLLIAGQTGSGKSICINVLIMSILMRTTPAEVKLILVDPKRVELSGYNGIPHLLTPVIVEADKVVSALKWTVNQMEERYKIFAEIGARNIDAYNKMVGYSAMPYIVIVIDEMADIMLYAPSEVEDYVNRLAQMARATGIHLVLATQRPSVNVITGLIKANIPARIAFSVSSMMDSRVILDTPGAEKLMGKGDMLYIPPDQAKPRRIQGSFVTDEEIKRVTEYWKNTGAPIQYTEEVTKKFKGKSNKGGSGEVDQETDSETDPLFEDSVRIICGYDRASASLLQRKLKIGYNRAARIMDQLFANGAVSTQEGQKPREVLIKNPDEFLAKLKDVS